MNRGSGSACRQAAALLLAASLAAQEPATPGLRVEREVFLRTGTSHRLAWSGDGRWIASGGGCGEVLVVEVATGKVVHELEATDHWIRGLAFAPDASALAVVGRDLSVWNLPGGVLRARHAVAGATPVAWSPDGTRLCCILVNETAALLDARDLKVLHTLRLPGDAAADSTAFSPDGKRVAVGKPSGLTFVFSAETGEREEKILQLGWGQELAWLADGRLLRLSWEGALHGFTPRKATVGPDAWGMVADPRGRLCLLWNGEVVRGLAPGAEPFSVQGGGAAAIAPDGVTWVRAHGQQLEFFTGPQSLRAVPLPHRAEVQQAALTGNGRYLAISDGNDLVQVFTTADGTPVDLRGALLTGDLLPNPAGNELAIWAGGFWEPGPGRLSLWSVDALHGGFPGPVRAQEFSTAAMPLFGDNRPCFSSDGRYFAVGNQLHDLLQPGRERWELTAQANQHLVPAWGAQRTLELLLHDSNPLGGFNSASLVLHGADGGELGAAEVREAAYDVAWSPDGKAVGVLARSGLRLLDADTLAERGLIAGSWRHLAWADPDRVLMLEPAGGVALLEISAPERATRIALPGTGRSVSIDHRGERAVVTLGDRAVLLRIGK